MALSTATKKSTPPQVFVAYGLCFAFALSTHHFVANGEFSSLLTMAAILQCFAFVLLGLQTLSSGHAAGISARALALDALALVCRLSSTTWLQGYLPVDASGDWLIQAVDACSLIIVVWLLYRIFFQKRWTYQADEDSFAAFPTALVCFVLAALLHADMNARPLFDALWMAGLFISVVAVLPQLWLIARTGGRVEALTSHYIAAMAIGRALSGIFMWYARFDITCDEWVTGINHAIWAILSAHLVHMLLLGDFAYYYVKAVVKDGLTSSMALGDDLGV